MAAYGRAGRLVAAIGMRRPARVMALQRLIAAGAPFPPPGPYGSRDWLGEGRTRLLWARSGP